MELLGRTIEFKLLLELNIKEVEMPAYLSSLGGKAVKDWVGDKYPLEDWEQFISELRKYTEAASQRMYETKQVFAGIKKAI